MALQNRTNLIVVSSGGSLSFGASYTVTVYEAGGIAASSASGSGGSTTVTMRAGHGFDVNDYAIQSLTASTFCRATAVSVNDVTFNANLSVSAGDEFVNLGDGDTGTTAPNYDGSDVAIYNSADSTDTVTNSRVTADSNGNYTYWRNPTNESWELIRDTSGTPVDVIPYSQGVDTSTLDSGTTLPTASTTTYGNLFLLTATDGSNEPGYYYCEQDPDNAGTYDWIKVGGWADNA